jgi:hypothetical protein
MELPRGETSELGIPEAAMFIVAILYVLIVWLCSNTSAIEA